MSNRDKLIKVHSSKEVINGKNGYTGLFKLEKGILMFDGASIAVSCIAEVSNEPIRRQKRLPWLMIVLSLLGLLLSAGLAVLGVLEAGLPLFMCFIYLVIYGLWERARPSKHGITILLNTGDKRYFIHRQKAFIDITYKAFVKALKEGRNYSANFNNTVVVHSGAHAGPIHNNNILNT